MGAKYLNSYIGNSQYSDATIFSLHPVKSITSGEGGLTLTNNKKLADKIAMAAENCGVYPRYIKVRRTANGIKKNKDVLMTIATSGNIWSSYGFKSWSLAYLFTPNQIVTKYKNAGISAAKIIWL